MYLFILISLIILLLIFLPIPIKISISYVEKNFHIYLFNFQIDLDKHKDKHIKKKKKVSKRKNKISINDLIYRLDNKKLKPSLKIEFNLNYGLGDAAKTAILYGILNCINPFIIRLIEIIFNIKELNSFVKPNFDESEFNVAINCIFFISMANIISILFLIFRCKHSYKTFNNITVSS